VTPLPAPPRVTFAVVTYGHRFARYANTTLPSWLGGLANASLVVFPGRRTDAAELAGAVRGFRAAAALAPALAADEAGIPYVDDFVQRAFDAARGGLLCVVMQDAFLADGFAWQVRFLCAHFARTRTQFGAVGRRCAALDAPRRLARLRPALDWVSAAANEEFSNDFILIDTRNPVVDLAEIPPFHVGMHAWDVWLVAHLAAQIPMVALAGECVSGPLQHKPEPMILAKVQEN
jgi:hypothetical protein